MRVIPQILMVLVDASEEHLPLVLQASGASLVMENPLVWQDEVAEVNRKALEAERAEQVLLASLVVAVVLLFPQVLQALEAE